MVRGVVGAGAEPHVPGFALLGLPDILDERNRLVSKVFE
jgi:hypothetical protein